jgi:hypothetical protein
LLCLYLSVPQRLGPCRIRRRRWCGAWCDLADAPSLSESIRRKPTPGTIAKLQSCFLFLRGEELMRPTDSDPECVSSSWRPPLFERCSSRAEGITNLSNQRNYSQLVKHVNSNWPSLLAPTSSLISTSSNQPVSPAHFPDLSLFHSAGHLPHSSLIASLRPSGLRLPCLPCLYRTALAASLRYFAYLPEKNPSPQSPPRNPEGEQDNQAPSPQVGPASRAGLLLPLSAPGRGWVTPGRSPTPPGRPGRSH